MEQVLSVVNREITYMESHKNFTKNRRLCRDDQTNFEYKQN